MPFAVIFFSSYTGICIYCMWRL